MQRIGTPWTVLDVLALQGVHDVVALVIYQLFLVIHFYFAPLREITVFNLMTWHLEERRLWQQYLFAAAGRLLP